MTTLREQTRQNFLEMSILEEHVYKARVYRRVASVLGQMSDQEFETRETFTDIYGIGQASQEKIEEFTATGSIAKLEALRESIPSLDSRLYKVRKSFVTKKISYARAVELYSEVRNLIQPLCSRVEALGSLRREKPLVGDVDIVVVSEDYEQVLDLLSKKYKVITRGEYKASFLIDEENNVPMDIIHSTVEEFPFQVLYLTGSQNFNIQMRAKAKSMGYKLNQKGLFIRDTEVEIPCLTESDIFYHLNMIYVEPRYR